MPRGRRGGGEPIRTIGTVSRRRGKIMRRKLVNREILGKVASKVQGENE